jgi:hypothetical protein
MHSHLTVATVLTLRKEGLGARRIARRTNLPVETVRDWLAGRLPRHSRDGVAQAAEPPCERCGREPHKLGHLPPSYVYLLGLYLGRLQTANHS